MDAPPQAGQYRVIYADPPWRFATHSDKGKGRSAEAHYCLRLERLIPIPSENRLQALIGTATIYSGLRAGGP
jgi:hypothetical protein